MTARQSSSALLVPTTPTNANHAASKSYVDSSISSATSGIAVAMDHVTGLVAALAGKADKSIFDAKGEILSSSAANTPAIVTAPSADGQFLKSATAQTAGMLWATPAAADVGLGNVNNTSDAVKVVASAAKLTTARNIAGVSFDGTAAISLTQDNIGDGSTNRSYTAAEKTKLAAITGTNTGDQTTISGNAGTATALATPRAINGVNFDGTAAITVNAVDATAREPAVAAGTTAQYYRGDKSWQAISGLAAGTAAILATPRAINGVNFDGSAAITINAVDATAREPSIAAGTAAQYWRGDKSWQAISSLAAGTAATLATPRAINGVNFDGSAAITVADSTKLPLAGGTLTGLLTLSGAPTTGLHAATKTYVDALERTWAPEAIICQGTLVTGYNDLPGGFAVEPGPNAGGVYLDAVWMRMGTIGASVTAQCILDVYVGTATTQGTLAVSVTMAAAATNQIATLGTSVAMGGNAVVRVYCSTAGTVTGPLHCQLRGRYHL